MDHTSGDVQVKLAAALTRISSLEREVDTKQRLLEDASSETERVRDGLERVIKELVAKNKTLDSDLRRIQSQHEHEMSEVLRAHESTVAELTDSRKQLQVLREAQSTSTAQIATSSAINREMVEELELHKHRRQTAEAALHETQKAMEELRISEQDARADVDELFNKLQRADQHLVQLTEEATAASVTASRLKAHSQQLQSERDSAHRAHEELVSRIKTPAAALAELVRGLMRDVDTALRDAQSAIEKPATGGGSSNSPSAGRTSHTSHRSSTPAWMDDPDSASTIPRLWPSDVNGLDDATCIVLAMQRISDVVPILSEDIALVRRTIGEASRREGDEIAQLDVLRDALTAERAHVSELADAARLSSEEVKKQNEEITRLNGALQDSAQWMAEAAQIGEERARRAENLALTIRSLENERNQLLNEVTRIREELHHTKLLGEVSNLGTTSSSSSHHNYSSSYAPASRDAHHTSLINAAAAANGTTPTSSSNTPGQYSTLSSGIANALGLTGDRNNNRSSHNDTKHGTPSSSQQHHSSGLSRGSPPGGSGGRRFGGK